MSKKRTNIKMRIKNALKAASIFSLFLLTACAMVPVTPTGREKTAEKDYVVVKATTPLSALAEKYLGDPSLEWVITEFNGRENIKPGEPIVIPLKAVSPGGLEPKGYQTIPILTYHRFSKNQTGKMIVKKRDFEKQMKFLYDENYHVITLDQLLDFLDFKRELPKKSVVITVDDGWRSFYTIAYPILKKYGYPSTLFIYTDFIGGRKALTWRQVEEISRNNVDIQCHTKSHRNLARMKRDESFEDFFNSVQVEMAESMKTIKKKLNITCTYIAYPYGAVNSMVVEMAKKNGLRGGFTVSRGSNPFFINNHMINRSVIYGHYNLKKFKDNLTLFEERKLN